MKLFHDPDGTITGLSPLLRTGERTCAEILERCLGRIDDREAEVRAWVVVDRDGAMQRARELDADLKNGLDRGPLHGIPIGIKDIIDVAGLPTCCGDPRDVDREAAPADAPIVKRLREAGAIILGKTVTTAYAWVDPPVTRNPWNLDHTPGGSSSGSAAAVACGMCIGAIGTQTGGSIIRPASFCGVAGMKPSFGRLSTEGILPLAASLDHPGPIARCVHDLRLIHEAIADRESIPDGGMDRSRGEAKEPPRLGTVGGYFDRQATEEVLRAIHAISNELAAAGATVADVLEPIDFDDVFRSHRIVMAFEAAAGHRERLALMPGAYPPRITELIREGESIADSDYQIERGLRDGRVAAMMALFDDHDALVTPATVGPAPDPSTTGDPAFNSPWSYLGFPTVSFPVGLSAGGLPLAVQLIGRPGDDLGLLGTADWCEKIARSAS
jgi:Asp-tRNA(Asn)/Glu-tRNA(Gln) amidotransferase A subunit family amidase